LNKRPAESRTASLQASQNDSTGPHRTEATRSAFGYCIRAHIPTHRPRLRLKAVRGCKFLGDSRSFILTTTRPLGRARQCQRPTPRWPQQLQHPDPRHPWRIDPPTNNRRPTPLMRTSTRLPTMPTMTTDPPRLRLPLSPERRGNRRRRPSRTRHPSLLRKGSRS
jgi:hypothetical protein